MLSITDCPNTGETVQNGACACANTGETVQNGACACPIDQILQNGVCACKSLHLEKGISCFKRYNN